MAKNSAEYDRNYRATVKPRNERAARQEGMREAIARCVKYFRERVAGKSITGYQAALMIERAMIEEEPAESEARRRFIDSMRGTEPA